MAEQLGKQALNNEEEQKKIKEIEERIASVNKERQDKLLKAATTITDKSSLEAKIKKSQKNMIRKSNLTSKT